MQVALQAAAKVLLVLLRSLTARGHHLRLNCFVGSSGSVGGDVVVVGGYTQDNLKTMILLPVSFEEGREAVFVTVHANIVDDDDNNDVNDAAVGRKRGGGEKRNELGPLGFSTFSCFGFSPSFYFSPPPPP